MELSAKNKGLQVGRHNRLSIVKLVDFGCYLDGGKYGEILMPSRYMQANQQVGDEVDVFVYFDSDDRLVATTEQPLAQVGEIAYLTVKEVSAPGAFLDWGLMKDLLVPRREQRQTMVAGKSYVVYVFQDPASGRIAATQKFARYLDNVMPQYKVGDKVKAIVTELTQLGYKVAVDNMFTGVIYESDVYRPLRVGDTLEAYIKKVRDDDKLDISPTPLGYARVDSLADNILSTLRANGGRMSVGDHSDPEQIRSLFGCSKKSFKMTIGTLMRQGQIEITPNGISITK